MFTGPVNGSSNAYAVSAGGGITRVDFGKSNSSRTLREPAHDRTPSRLAVSDDGLYLATLNYGTVEVIDLPGGEPQVDLPTL